MALSCALAGACTPPGPAAPPAVTSASSVVPADVDPGFGYEHIVFGGSTFRCARMTDATVQCWGRGGDGQLGDGTRHNRDEPAPVPGLGDVVEIAVGGYHACARHRDGTVSCWGRNASGEIGDGTTEVRPSPVAVPDVTTAAGLALGWDFSCVRLEDGSVRCWGDNGWGILGRQSREPKHVLRPEPVAGVGGIVELAAGGGFLCGLEADGHVTCWGETPIAAGGDTPRPPARIVVTRASHLALGARFGCAIVTGAKVRCWGSDAWSWSDAPGPRPFEMPGLEGVTDLVAGDDVACALLGDGSARCWGSESNGAMGSGLMLSNLHPAPVAELEPAERLSASHHGVCAYRPKREVLCWGEPFEVSPPLGRAEPARVPLDAKIVHVAAGDSSSCAVDGAGRTLCWGYNRYGALGDGTEIERRRPAAIALAPAAELGLGRDHGCAALRSGAVACWGKNLFGNVGVSGSDDQRSPVAVAGLSDIVAVAAGEKQSCALARDGTVRCFGDHRAARPAPSPGYRPFAVPLGEPATSIALGSYHGCAALASGAASCWGTNGDGQLGDGGRTDRYAPGLVKGLAGVKAIAARDAATCALLETGRVACWGEIVGSDTPHDVGLEGARSIAVGGRFACAVVAGGVSCFGYNHFGELGVRGPDVRPAPLPVPNLDDIVAVATGRAHACALDRAGRISCWGSNALGTLGDGESARRVLPTRVGAARRTP